MDVLTGIGSCGRSGSTKVLGIAVPPGWQVMGVITMRDIGLVTAWSSPPSEGAVRLEITTRSEAVPRAGVALEKSACPGSPFALYRQVSQVRWQVPDVLICPTLGSAVRGHIQVGGHVKATVLEGGNTLSNPGGWCVTSSHSDEVASAFVWLAKRGWVCNVIGHFSVAWIEPLECSCSCVMIEAFSPGLMG